MPSWCRTVPQIFNSELPKPVALSASGTNRLLEVGQSMSALPGMSDINLFRYCEGIIYLDAEISHRAFDLGMSEQELDGPEIVSPPVDQGSFCPSQ